jgi:murein DD-endopeptidase MepM/ murein hydrolase activator NlpD
LKNRYKSVPELNWSYSIADKYNLADAATLNGKTKKISGAHGYTKIDYTNFDFKGVLNTAKPKRNFNFSAVYSGILFIFFFGFLFFLSISIGYASTGSMKDYDEKTFYGKENGEKILNQFLFSEKAENKETVKFNFKKAAFEEYVSEKNDTFVSVAKKFGISEETIYLANNIKKKTALKPGKKLIIPNQNGRLVTLEKSSSIYTLADKYGVKWQNIADVNNLESSSVKPGMKIFIAGSRMTKYEKEEFDGRFFIMPVMGAVTSGFGMRIDPITGILDFHSGIDIKGDCGTPVKVARDGKVIYTGWQRVYGNFIMVKHDKNIITIYAHLESIDAKEGQKVAQGDIIGKVGATGRVTGPHLHFEVRVNEKIINPFSFL